MAKKTQYGLGHTRLTVPGRPDLTNKTAVVMVGDKTLEEALEGAGTFDYSDLTDKPQINGVELSGNKTSSDLGVATSQQGAKADTAYQKPNTGIPETDLSSDVQQALQKHFKGWWPDLATLKAAHTATEGDSAYVKDASPATTWSIYVYDSTASSDNYWADSGTDADTTYVQTFKTGEQVNAVGIDSEPTGNSDNLVTSGGVYDKIGELSGVITKTFTISADTLNGLPTNLRQIAYLAGKKVSIKLGIDSNAGIQFAVAGYAKGSETLDITYHPYGTEYFEQDIDLDGDVRSIQIQFKKANGTTITASEVVNAITSQSITYTTIIPKADPIKGELAVLLGGWKNVMNDSQPEAWSDIVISPNAFPRLLVKCPDYLRVSFTWGTYCNATASPTDSNSPSYGGDYIIYSQWMSNDDVVGKSGWKNPETLQFAVRVRLIGNNRGINTDFIKSLYESGELAVWIQTQGIMQNDIVTRQYDSEKNVKALQKRTLRSFGTRDLPMFVHVSDIHSDANRFADALVYANYLKASAVVNTGDNVSNGFECGQRWFAELEAKYRKYGGNDRDAILALRPFFNVIGNHDSWHASSYSDVLGKLIHPFRDYYSSSSSEPNIASLCADCYLESSGTKTTHGYYYNDFEVAAPRDHTTTTSSAATTKIRLIVIDLCEGMTSYSIERWHVSQTQINWFIGILASTPADTLVVVALHTPPDSLVKPTAKAESFNTTTDAIPMVDDAFMNKDHFPVMINGGEASPNGLLGYHMTGNPIVKIIDGFNNRAVGSGSYTQYDDSSTPTTETITYSFDFTSVADGAEFVMYINGHTHRDYIGFCQNADTLQLNACVTCTTCGEGGIARRRGANSSDLPRGTVGSTCDAFNVYAIDRINGMVGIARVGSNVAADGSERKMEWVSYKSCIPFKLNGVQMYAPRTWQTIEGSKANTCLWGQFARLSLGGIVQNIYAQNFLSETGLCIKSSGSSIVAVTPVNGSASNGLSYGTVKLEGVNVATSDEIVAGGNYVIE